MNNQKEQQKINQKEIKKLWFEDQGELHVQSEFSQFHHNLSQQLCEEQSLHPNNKKKLKKKKKQIIKHIRTTK